MLLTIQTIDGLTTARSPWTNDVWIFTDGGEARQFIHAYFADDVRS